MKVFKIFDYNLKQWLYLIVYLIILIIFRRYLLLFKMQTQAIEKQKQKEEQKTSNTLNQIRTLQQSNNLSIDLAGNKSQEQQRQNKEYRQYMDNVTLVMTLQQIIKRLQRQQISYDHTFQRFSQRNFQMLEMQETKNGEACLLTIKVGIFIIKLNILNIPEHSKMHQCPFTGNGSFGAIYEFNLNKNKIICKCINYKAITLNNKLNKEQINDQITVLIKQVLKQVSFLKIFSALEIGPKAISYLGFDLIIYDECIEFTMEKCEKRGNIQINHQQQLKESLKLMHSLRIAHRDIKLGNILYSKSYQKYVFCDFGTTISLRQTTDSRSMTERAGTQAYMSHRLFNMSKQNRQLANLYHNDVHALKITCQKLPLLPLNSMLDYSDYQNEIQLFNLIKMKHMALTQKFENLLELLKISKLKKYFQKEILQFLLEMTPNEKIRQFYVHNYYNRYPNSQSFKYLNKIYGQKTILSYVLPKDKLKQSRYFINLKRLRRLKQVSNHDQEENIFLKIQVRRLSITEEIKDIPFQQYCKTYIMYMSSFKYSTSEKVKISKSFYQCFSSRINLYQKYRIRSSVPTRIQINKNQNVVLIFKSLKIAFQYVFNQLKDNFLKEILLKRLFLIHSRDYADNVAALYCLRELNKINNDFGCLMQFSFLALTLTTSIWKQTYQIVEVILQRISKSQNSYQSSIANAIIGYCKNIYKYLFQGIQNTFQFCSVMEEDVKNIIELIDKKKQINQDYQRIIMISYLNLFLFYRRICFNQSALKIYDYVLSEPRFRKFKRFFIILAASNVRKIYQELQDKAKLRSFLKHLETITQSQDYMEYLNQMSTSEIDMVQPEKQKFRSFQFYNFIYRFSTFQKPNYKRDNVQKLKQMAYYFFFEKQTKAQPQLQRLAIVYILVYYLSIIKVNKQKPQSLIQNEENIKLYQKLLYDFQGLLEQSATIYKAKLEMRKRNYHKAFYLFMDLQNIFYSNKKTLTCIRNAVLCFQHNLYQNQQKINCSKEEIKQLLTKYFKYLRQHEQFLSFVQFQQDIYCLKLFIEICVRNGDLQQCFEQLKWQAKLNSKYDSQKLYNYYLGSIQIISIGATRQFYQSLLSLSFHSKFYEQNSLYKELALLAAIIISKIYRHLSGDKVNEMFYKIFKVFNFVCKTTQAKIMNFAYKIISFHQQNKRKKKYFIKKHFKITLMPISENKYLRKYQMKGEREDLSSKILILAMKLCKKQNYIEIKDKIKQDHLE